jgi:hypothetical protein
MKKVFLFSMLTFIFALSANAADTMQVRVAVYKKVGDVKSFCQMPVRYLFADSKKVAWSGDEIMNASVPNDSRWIKLRNFDIGGTTPTECNRAILELPNGAVIEGIREQDGTRDFSFYLNDNGTGRDIAN